MYDVIIIGGGPAGLMCANHLKTNDFIVLEKKEKPLNKLLISGNGRCNFSNNKCNEDFLSEVEHNKKYLYSTINLFGPKEIISYFRKYFKVKEEDDNKMFPYSDNSSDVYNVLTKTIKSKLKCLSNVLDISKEENYFIVETNQEKLKSKIVVIATGGGSFPHTGSSKDHIKFARKFNQNIINLYPAETSIILDKQLDNVNGISFNNVNVKIRKIVKSGNLMFTTNGLSGNVIMNLSGYIAQNNINELYVDFLPDKNIEKLLEESLEKEIIGAFNGVLTKKFIYSLFKDCDFFHKKIKSISKKEKLFIIDELKNKKFNIKKVNDLVYAYVTGGGIDLKYINTKTFESKIVKNLYFAGESLDIHGPIGGYNITLALSTGYSISENINKLLKK